MLQSSNDRNPSKKLKVTAIATITLQRHLDLLILVVILFIATIGPSAVLYPSRIPPGGWFEPVALDRTKTGIDPNTAEWFEWAQLPGIGETIAKRAVAYRRRYQGDNDLSRVVFQKQSDLLQIKGIGEKRIQRIKPFLRWPDSKDDR